MQEPTPRGPKGPHLPSGNLSPRNPLDYLRLLGWICLTPDRVVAYRERFGPASIERVGTWLASTLIWLPVLIPTLARGLGLLPTPHQGRYWVLNGGLVLGWMATGALGTRWDSKTIGIWAGIVLGFLSGAFFMVELSPAIALAGGAAAVVALVVAFVVAWVAVADVERSAGERAEWIQPTTVERLEWVLVTSMAAGVAFGVAFSALLVVGATVGGGEIGGLLLMIAGVIAFALLFMVARGRVAKAVKESLRTGQPTWLGRGALAALVLSYAVLVWVFFLGGWRALAPPS